MPIFFDKTGKVRESDDSSSTIEGIPPRLEVTHMESTHSSTSASALLATPLQTLCGHDPGFGEMVCATLTDWSLELFEARLTTADITLGHVVKCSITQLRELDFSPKHLSRLARVLVHHGQRFRDTDEDGGDPRQYLIEDDGAPPIVPLVTPQPAPPPQPQNGPARANGTKNGANRPPPTAAPPPTNGFHANGTNGKTPAPNRLDLLRKIHESKKTLPDDPERFLRIGDTTTEEPLRITLDYSFVPQEAATEDGVTIKRLPLVTWEGGLMPRMWLPFLIASERGRAGLPLGNHASSVDDVLHSLLPEPALKQPTKEAPAGITAYLAHLQSRMPLSFLMTKAELKQLNANRDPDNQLTIINDLRKATRQELQAAVNRVSQEHGALRAIIAACRTAGVVFLGEAPPKPAKPKPEPPTPPPRIERSPWRGAPCAIEQASPQLGLDLPSVGQLRAFPTTERSDF